MFSQSKMKYVFKRSTPKMPLDAKVIGWLIVIPAIVFFLIGLLLLIGLADIPFPDARPAMFGIISVVSEVEFGVYFFCIGIIGILTGYCIATGRKCGWWCLLVLFINDFFNGIMMLPRYETTILTSTLIKLVLIVWLIKRRQLYNIGIKIREE